MRELKKILVVLVNFRMLQYVILYNDHAILLTSSNVDLWAKNYCKELSAGARKLCETEYCPFIGDILRMLQPRHHSLGLNARYDC